MPVPDCVEQREIGPTPSVVLRILASHFDRSNQDIQRVVELLTRDMCLFTMKRWKASKEN